MISDETRGPAAAPPAQRSRGGGDGDCVPWSRFEAPACLRFLAGGRGTLELNWLPTRGNSLVLRHRCARATTPQHRLLLRRQLSTGNDGGSLMHRLYALFP